MKTSNHWVVFGVCSGLFLMSLFYRASAAVIATELARDLSLSHEDLGLLGAVFFYVFALAQFPLGAVLDRWGSKTTMVILNMIGVAGTLVFAASDGLGLGLLGRGLMGLGMSANMMGSLNLFTRWFRRTEFATVSGLLVSVGSLGGLLATTPLVFLVSALGWRGGFFILAALNLSLTVLFVVLVQDAPNGTSVGTDRGAKHRSPWQGALKLFRNRSYWTIAIAAGLRYGVLAALQALWAGPFLMLYLGFSDIAAGNFLLLFNVGYVVGAPLGGLISDRWLQSRKRAMLIGLMGNALSVLVLAFWPGQVMTWLLGLVWLVFGVFAAFGQLLYAHIKDLMPSEMSGTAMTGVNFFVFVGAGVFLHGLGGILERTGAGPTSGGDYRLALIFCFAALLLAVVVYGLSRDFHPGNSGRQSSEEE